MLIWVLLGIIPGISVALQSPTNVALSKEIGRFESSLVSFVGGLICLVPFILIFGTGDITLAANAQFWQLLGGLYAAINVVVVVYAGPVIGIALSLMLNMLGQLLMGMVIDALGLFGIERIAIAPLRVAGCLLVAIGVVLTYLGKKAPQNGAKQRDGAGSPVIAVSLAFLSGIGSAVQAPTNRSLAAMTGGLEATMVSIIVSISLFVVLIVASRIRRALSKGKERAALSSHAARSGRGSIRPWMLTGGVYCFINIFLNLTVVKYLGAALLAACFMFGQLGGSTVVDTFGLLRSEKIALNRPRTAGLLCILLGIILCTLAAVQAQAAS